MPSTDENRIRKHYELLGEDLSERSIDIGAVKTAIRDFEVEVPSWLFGDFGGGRFGAYTPPAPAPDGRAKVRDAAFVHRLSGAAPRVAIHVGWDKPDDVAFDDVRPEHFDDLKAFALEQGIDLGAVNPTLFLEGTHYGSLGSPLEDVRARLIDHCLTSCQIAQRHAQGLVTYWLPDGSSYPGQVDLWGQEKLVREAFQRIYAAAPDTVVHLIEYKLFEPGTYSTTVCDAGVSLNISRALGDRAGVLVDMGHHAWGVNVAQIVARLLGLGVRGGFHFNSRYAADDDHAVEPNIPMYAIFCELAAGGVITGPGAWPYMIDQCCSIENRMRSVLHTIDSLHVSLAKALILDRKALAEARADHDLIGANRIFLDAFLTDVRPVVRMARIEQDLPPDPVKGYDDSGYQKQIEKERG